MKFLTFFLSIAFFLQSYAQDARYTYGPVTGANLDDMLAIAAKVYDNNDIEVETFNYSQGTILSTHYNFTILISPYRAKILVNNTDDGVYLSLVELQMKGEYGYKDVESVIGKKCDKLIKSFGKEFEKISEDPAEIEKAKIEFYNDPNTHYLFFKKATELAADRWYETFMKDKVFSWDLKFSDIKKNESSRHKEFKYIVTARYYTGSSLAGLGGLYVKLYTNSDSEAMTEKNSIINIEGKCVGFNENMGYYYINFIAAE
jgi:hypothetical protein